MRCNNTQRSQRPRDEKRYRLISDEKRDKRAHLAKMWLFDLHHESKRTEDFQLAVNAREKCKSLHFEEVNKIYMLYIG